MDEEAWESKNGNQEGGNAKKRILMKRKLEFSENSLKMRERKNVSMQYKHF